jgi:hypothetical protein
MKRVNELPDGLLGYMQDYLLLADIVSMSSSPPTIQEGRVSAAWRLPEPPKEAERGEATQTPESETP